MMVLIAGNVQIYALRQSRLYYIRKAIFDNSVRFYFDELIISFIQSNFGQT